jgi:hypothetical protein
MVNLPSWKGNGVNWWTAATGDEIPDARPTWSILTQTLRSLHGIAAS